MLAVSFEWQVDFVVVWTKSGHKGRLCSFDSLVLLDQLLVGELLVFSSLLAAVYLVREQSAAW